MPHVEVRLIDKVDPDENPHLDYVLLDTVRVIEQFRQEGRNISTDESLRDVTATLPGAHPDSAFRQRCGAAELTPCSPE